MKLSQQQLAHFETFGFLVLRKVFTADEMATIKRESDEIFSEGLGNTLPHGRVALQPFFERRPFTSTLVADDRIYGIGESLLGPEFFLCLTEGNLHAGDTFWHGGGMWDEEARSVKITFYPEALTAATGSLRVVPGSRLTILAVRPVSRVDYMGELAVLRSRWDRAVESLSYAG